MSRHKERPRTPRVQRRRILLAMGFQSYERQTGIIRYAREAGWILDARLFAFHAVGQDWSYLRCSNFDGVLALCSRAAPWLVRVVKQLSIPVVDMWADYPALRCPRVLLDHVAIGRVGAEHLLARGFRELLFYTHALERRVASLRWQGFAAAAESAGARARQIVWDHRAPAPNGQNRVDRLAKWLAAAPLPLGVMGSNDFIAGEVLEAAQLASLDVPRQVAVVGVDNDPLATDLAVVPLSSIHSAKESVGYEAAALLDRIIRGEPPPPGPVLVPPGRVVTRRSSDALAVRDADVAAAIKFIHERFRDPITVGEVAARYLVSRRHLQDCFLNETGRTISETITWKRLDHAQHLLLETVTKVELIAHESGLGTGENLCKIFRRHVGISPQAYREKYGRRASGQPYE
jgi:LacI family transcriptional regulator